MRNGKRLGPRSFAYRDIAAIRRYSAPFWREMSRAPSVIAAQFPVGERIVGFVDSLRSLSEQGYSLTDISMMFGVSRERVRQWCVQYNVTRLPMFSPPRRWDWDTGRFVPILVKRSAFNADIQRAKTERRRKVTLDSLQERFWKQAGVTKTDSDCWYWRGPTQNVKQRGSPDFRGMVTLPPAALVGKSNRHGSQFAHRVAFLFANGYMPEGRVRGSLLVCHSCHNGLCVNPAHLYLANQKENIAYAKAAGRHSPRSVKCRHGHSASKYRRTPSGHPYCTSCNREAYLRDRKARV